MSGSPPPPPLKKRRAPSYLTQTLRCIPASHAMHSATDAVPTPLVVDVPAGQSLLTMKTATQATKKSQNGREKGNDDASEANAQAPALKATDRFFPLRKMSRTHTRNRFRFIEPSSPRSPPVLFSGAWFGLRKKNGKRLTLFSSSLDTAHTPRTQISNIFVAGGSHKTGVGGGTEK